MGETRKAIKQEVKAIYKNVLGALDDQQKKLTSSEKLELREYIESLSAGTSHSFSHIFIDRKIRQLINARSGGELHDTGAIDDLIDDEEEGAIAIEVEKPSLKLQRINDEVEKIYTDMGECHLISLKNLAFYIEGYIKALRNRNLINEQEWSALHSVWVARGSKKIINGVVVDE